MAADAAGWRPTLACDAREHQPTRATKACKRTAGWLHRRTACGNQAEQAQASKGSNAAASKDACGNQAVQLTRTCNTQQAEQLARASEHRHRETACGKACGNRSGTTSASKRAQASRDCLWELNIREQAMHLHRETACGNHSDYAHAQASRDCQCN